MSPGSERQAAQLVGIIRGENGWASLEDGGIEVRRSGEEWWFSPSKLMAFPDVDDLAVGLIGLSSDAARLQEWAAFVLPASFIDKFGEVGPNGCWTRIAGRTLGAELGQSA